jgi:hypothetical protein
MTSSPHGIGSSASPSPTYRPVAQDVQFTATMLRILLVDGRELLIPLAQLPFLANASAAERQQWELTYDREGIHWTALDEWLSIAKLLGMAED